MTKTITIIQLLNKIANGEEVPKKINYNDKIFEFDELEKVYVTSNFDNSIMEGLDLYLYIEGLKQDSLNDEVEIIEEQEEIEIIEGWGLATDYKDFETINNTLDIFGNKINELVQAVKQLDNKLKEK